VEAVVDIAGAWVRTPPGRIRDALVGWLRDHAHARAEALRSSARDAESAHKGDLLALVSMADVFEEPGHEVGEDDVGRMWAALDKVLPPMTRPSSSHSSVPFGRITPEGIQSSSGRASASFARAPSRVCSATGI